MIGLLAERKILDQAKCKAVLEELAKMKLSDGSDENNNKLQEVQQGLQKFRQMLMDQARWTTFEFWRAFFRKVWKVSYLSIFVASYTWLQ